MSSSIKAAIRGTGAYLPELVVTNQDLERLVDTSDQWILERTGIRERRKAAPHETTGTMSLVAARRALENSGVDASELDLIIVATCTPDYPLPATACLLQHELGATRAAAFDMEVACTGFIYACHVASGMIVSGMHRNVLVVGAETLTRIIDYTDRGSCILFGDGAGAVVMGPATNGAGLLYSRVASDGSQADVIRLPAGGSKSPASDQTVAARQHYLQIEGRRVFKFATNTFVDLIHDALQQCQLRTSDVSLIVPHQVNERIITAAMERLDFPLQKVYVNIDRYGNTSAASVPIALDEARRNGRLAAGDIAILLAFGAGLTWGSAVFRF